MNQSDPARHDVPSQVQDFFASAKMPMTLTDPDLPDCPILATTPAFASLTGFRADEIIGRNCRFLQGEQTQSEAREDIRDAIDRRSSVSVTIANYKKDGRQFDNVLLIRPISAGHMGGVRFLLGVQFDSTTFDKCESYGEFLKSEHKSFDDQPGKCSALMSAHVSAAKVAQDRICEMLQPCALPVL